MTHIKKIFLLSRFISFMDIILNNKVFERKKGAGKEKKSDVKDSKITLGLIDNEKVNLNRIIDNSQWYMFGKKDRQKVNDLFRNKDGTIPNRKWKLEGFNQNMINMIIKRSNLSSSINPNSKIGGGFEYE